MSEDILTAAQMLYKNVKAPVLILDGTDNIVWRNAQAQNDLFCSNDSNIRELLEQANSGGRLKKMLAANGRAQVGLEMPGSGVLSVSFCALEDATLVTLFGVQPQMEIGGNFASAAEYFGDLMRRSVFNKFLNMSRLETSTPFDDEQLKSIECIKRSDFILYNNYINSAILTSYYAGTQQVRPSGCDLGALAESLCAAAAAVCPRTKIIYSGEPHCVCCCDGKLVERALVNLLLNSLKYGGADAPVKINLQRRGDNIEISVRDRGNGIRPENLELVKQPYFSVDPLDDAEIRPGLGAGLSVADVIARLHGGRLMIASEFSVGTAVVMALPAKEAEPDARLESPSAARYVTDHFSVVYVGLSELCELPV